MGLENMSREDLKKEISIIKNDEKELVFNDFSSAVALELGNHIIKKALERNAAVTIDIRKGDHILFHYSMEGTTENNARWVKRKSNTVQLLHKSSFRVGLENRLKGESLASRQYLDPGEYAEHGGSFPLRVKGAGVIGAVTVSGLPQEEDHRLVADSLREFLRQEDEELLR